MQKNVEIRRKKVGLIRHAGGFDFVQLEFEVVGHEELGVRVVQVPVTTTLQDKVLLPNLLDEATRETQRILQAVRDAVVVETDVLAGAETFTLAIELTDAQ